MTRERMKQKLKHDIRRALAVGKWVVFSCITGALIGPVGALFCWLMSLATKLRTTYPHFLYLLPFGAIIIQYTYSALKKRDVTYSATGTNLVLSAIQSKDEIPRRMAPLIFVSTIFSHLAGASVGREGAALQMGGSIGNAIGRLFRLDEQDKHTIIMCGMSAAFSAVFGTPLTAAVFSMEVVSVGIMHYGALLPCVISSFIARAIAGYFGFQNLSFSLPGVPAFGVGSAVMVALFAVVCGVASMVFCVALSGTERIAKRRAANVYVRAFIGGTAVLLLTLLSGSQTYNGTGIGIIEAALSGGEIFVAAFIPKAVFTILSIAAGYRGGEIVPSFCIGTSLGVFFGWIFGLSSDATIVLAAIGMGAFFCGVTNCPITSFLLCVELFGMEGAPFFLIAVAVSYTISGYYGLYKSQRILYSKYKSNYINKKTE